MRMTIQKDPNKIVLEPTSLKDNDMLEKNFGLNAEGKSITLTHGDILGVPDRDGNRPVIGFQLVAYGVAENPNAVTTELIEETPEPEPESATDTEVIQNGSDTD